MTALQFIPGEPLPRGTVLEMLRSCGQEPIYQLLQLIWTEAPDLELKASIYLRLMDYCYPKVKAADAADQAGKGSRPTRENVAELCRIARGSETERAGDEK